MYKRIRQVVILLFSFIFILSGKYSNITEQLKPVQGKQINVVRNIKNTGKSARTNHESLTGYVNMNVKLSSDDLCFFKIGDYTRIEIKNPNQKILNVNREPQLPTLSYRVSIPTGTELSRIEVRNAVPETLPGNYKIYPSQPPGKISSTDIEKIEFLEPDEEIYSSNNPYPGRTTGLLHTGTKSGYRIGTFRIFPVQYIPGSGKIILYRDIELLIHYSPYESKVIPRRQKQVEHFSKTVEKMVLNPDDVRKFKPPVGLKDSKQLPAGFYEYVIIALSSYEDYWSPLLHWKKKKGLSSKFVSKSYITSNYPGDTEEEQIKNFMDDANTTWGTMWFVLGGDVGSLAHAPCYGNVSTNPPTIDNNLASTRFYEDLDNDWDYDNDQIYGEYTDGPGGGDVDLYADCYVGRMCVESIDEITSTVDRIINYEKSPTSGYVEKMLFWTEELWTNVYGYYTADQLQDTLGMQCSYTELYDGEGNYVSDDNAVGELNTGYGWTVVCSHGGYDRVMQGSPSSKNVTTSDLDALLNIQNEKYGIHTGMCCMSGGYHEVSECYAEHLHIDAEGGVAAIFNSEYGWGNSGATSPGSWQGWSNYIKIKFIANAFNRNHYNIGEALGLARDFYVDSISGDGGVWRWCMYEYNLLGDPEMPVWTKEPGQLEASHAPEISPGSQTFSVNVTDGSNPVNNARVCLWCKKDSTMWKVDYTDLNGDVDISIEPDSLLDTMWVTVSKPNLKPYEGYAYVTGNIYPSKPRLLRLFDNALINTNPAFECTLSFKSTDPEGEDIEYEIEWGNNDSFVGSDSKTIGPYPSGNTVITTIPAVQETLYFWRARATDPSGSGRWSGWSNTRSFTMDMELGTDWAYWYQISAPQFNRSTMANVSVEGDSVVLNESGGAIEKTYTTEIVENWDDGDYTGWYASETGDTTGGWVVGTTEDMGSYQPPNYGTYYAYYSDDNAGSGAGATTKKIFYQSTGISTDTDSLKVYYEYGYRDYTNEYFGFYVFFHYPSNDIWTPSNAYCSYSGSSESGSELIDLSDTLYHGHDTLGIQERPDSFKITWIYDDNGGNWGYAAAIDSVHTFTIDTTSLEIAEGILTTHPIVYANLKEENNNRDNWDGIKLMKSSPDDSIGIQVEYLSGGTWNLIPDGEVPGNSTGIFDLSDNFNTVNLSLLNENIYDTLRIKVLFRRNTSKASSNPSLKMLAIGNTDPNITGIRDNELAVEFKLYKNQPNPFMGMTEIRYQIPEKEEVNIDIYDIMGRNVVNLISEKQKAGSHSVRWTGLNSRGEELPSGIYFLQLKAGSHRSSLKMLKLR